MKKKLTQRQCAAMDTKQKIIEAANKIISKKGFDNITVDDIMSEAGFSKGTFYTYFSRKEDVVSAINRSDFYSLAETVNEMTDKNIVEKLEIYCFKFMDEIEKCGIEICRQWVRNNISSETADKITDDSGNSVTKYEHDLNAMKKIISEAVNYGELISSTPVDKLAYFINNQLYGMMIAWCMTDGTTKGSANVNSFIIYIIEPCIKRYMTKNK